MATLVKKIKTALKAFGGWIIHMVHVWESAETKERVKAFAITLLIVAGFILIVGGARLNHRIEQINSGTSPAAVTSAQYRAEQQFLLCSRNSALVAPDRKADAERVCEGYESLEAAYKTENVEPRTP